MYNQACALAWGRLNKRKDAHRRTQNEKLSPVSDLIF